MADSNDGPAQVVREVDTTRRFTRIRLPARAILDGTTHPVADWSIAGAGVLEVEKRFATGETIEVQLVVPYPGFEFATAIDCQVVYADSERRRLGLRFVRVRPEQTAVLRSLVEACLVGRMPTSEGILHVGAQPPSPLRPVPPVSQDIHEPPRGGRVRRALGYMLLIGLGAILLVLAGAKAYGYLFTVEAFMAAVVANSRDIRAPIDGYLAGPSLTPGARVQAGTMLFALRNDPVEAELGKAAADLRKEAIHLETLRQALAERRGFFAEYRVSAASELRKARAEWDRAKTAMELANTRLRRVADLQQEGLVAAQILDDERRALAAAEMEFRRAEAAVPQAESNLRMAARGQYYTGSRLEGGEPREIERQVQVAEAAVAAARARVEGLREQIAGAMVSAPCDCLVHLVGAYPGEWVPKGQSVYTLKLADERGLRVEALVPQQVAGTVQVGSPADVLLADRKAWVSGRVVAVNRTGAAEKRAGMPHLPPGGEAQYAAVIVQSDRMLEHVPAGLPARVIFRVRRPFASFFALARGPTIAGRA